MALLPVKTQFCVSYRQIWIETITKGVLYPCIELPPLWGNTSVSGKSPDGALWEGLGQRLSRPISIPLTLVRISKMIIKWGLTGEAWRDWIVYLLLFLGASWAVLFNEPLHLMRLGRLGVIDLGYTQGPHIHNGSPIWTGFGLNPF